MCSHASRNKYESHETCSCQYLGGGLLGDTNRLGGEGVDVHFLEDMAFFSNFWPFPK